MHHAIASSVLNTNIPITMPDTFNKVENTPQMNKLLVSLAAWKIEPDVDNIICIPTDIIISGIPERRASIDPQTK